jgi:hypothetical protein
MPIFMCRDSGKWVVVDFRSAKARQQMFYAVTAGVEREENPGFLGVFCKSGFGSANCESSGKSGKKSGRGVERYPSTLQSQG